jgi:hypothetical protein
MKDAGFVYNSGILDDLIANDVAGILPLIERKMIAAATESAKT